MKGFVKRLILGTLLLSCLSVSVLATPEFPSGWR
jgi:hypothetical protein